MENEADIMELSDGSQYYIEGFGALSPEQKTQRVAQGERAIRVETAATSYNKTNDDLSDRSWAKWGVNQDPNAEPSFIDKVSETMDEFGRNYTFGIPEYVGAATSYLPTQSNQDTFGDMDFLERRDAIERAQDIQSDILPESVDTAASLAGVLSSGGSGLIQGPKEAAKAGLMIGGLDAFGNSNAQNWEGVAADTAIGSGVGAGTGVAADFLLDKIIGGGARKVLGSPDAAAQKAASDAIGIPASTGSIGSDIAARLENSFSEQPLSAGIGRLLDALPFTGRGAAGVNVAQQEGMPKVMHGVTDEMAPGVKLKTNDAEMAPYIRDQAQTMLTRSKDEMADLEAGFTSLVDPRTPVGIKNTEALPQKMTDEGESVNLFRDPIQSEVDLIRKNVDDSISPKSKSVVDPVKEGMLQNQLGTVNGELKRANKQYEKLAKADPDSKQLAVMNRDIRRLGKKRDKLEADILGNRGPGFKALRGDRSNLGRNVRNKEGLPAAAKKQTYAAISQDMEAQLYKKGGKKLVDRFKAMTEKEREAYAAIDLVKPMATVKGASKNLPFVKSALLKGNDAELAALTSKMKPAELSEFRANALQTLGRNSKQEPFSTTEWAGNWRKASDAAKDMLSDGNPETRATLEALATVAEGMSARGRKANHSNTASNAGVMAMLGSMVGSPDKIATFLGTVLGIDRGLASEAMTKAVAGEHTALGNLIRDATVKLSTSPDAKKTIQDELGMER